MSNAKHSPDLLFEVSWEVCNKVGGIHTVISTKAQTVTRKFADRYVLLGPDLSHEGVNPEFEEDPNQLKAWRQSLYNEGIRVRVGRWKIKGEPTVVLVDFSSLIPRKDEILKSLWESYHVDSISGQWDYIEPVLFGWAAGVVIASYVETFGTPTEKAVAHFHEWMTAAGGLYLRKHAPYIATVFTTHATVMGRCIAGNRLPLYNDLPKFNADELARQFNVTAKHSIEKMAAAYHDAFLTVSDITANECKYLLGREGQGMEVAIHSLSISRVHIAASNLGMCQRMLEMSIARANDRITFGKPIATRQAIKMKIADMAAATHALRCLVYDFARDFDVDPHNEYVDEKAAICKLNSIQAVKTCSDEMLEIFGGDGYFEDSPYGPTERLYRDCRALWLEEGAPTVQRITIARECQRLKAQLGYQD